MSKLKVITHYNTVLLPSGGTHLQKLHSFILYTFIIQLGNLLLGRRISNWEREEEMKPNKHNKIKLLCYVEAARLFVTLLESKCDLSVKSAASAVSNEFQACAPYFLFCKFNVFSNTELTI